MYLNRYLLILIFLWSNLSAEFSFLVDSDMHCAGTRSLKTGRATYLRGLVASNPDKNFKAILLTGDLTDSGKEVGTYCVRTYTQDVDEWGQFKREWIDKLKDVLDIQECPGNHDTLGGSFCIESPALTRIKQRHGALNYSFDIEGIHFVCCGIYPDATVRNWLKTDLAKYAQNCPIVLFFHYNILGQESNWWASKVELSEKNTLENITQKEAFCNIIKNYKIIGIFTGHWHESYMVKWKNFNNYSAAGKYFAICTYRPENKSLEVFFSDETGILIPSENLTLSI